MKYAKIELGKIKVDPEYQRPRNEAFFKMVGKIVSEFKPELAWPLFVNMRENGDIFVWDGQARLEAAKILGFAAAECKVVQVGGMKDEALLFKRQTAKDKRMMKSSDVFFAAIAAGCEKETKIKEICESAGLEVVRRVNTSRQVEGTSALLYCYERFGAETLKNALGIIGSAWGSEERPFQALIIKGMCFFISKTSAKGHAIDKQKLIKKLASAGFNEVQIKSKAFKKATGGAHGTETAAAICTFYQYREPASKYNFSPIDMLGKGPNK